VHGEHQRSLSKFNECNVSSWLPSEHSSGQGRTGSQIEIPICSFKFFRVCTDKQESPSKIITSKCRLPGRKPFLSLGSESSDANVSPYLPEI
jgi:hypothetical protein